MGKSGKIRCDHRWLLLGWVAYFAMYLVTENCIAPENCHVVWCPLDDLIPFCEWFLIPYVFWYGLVAFSLLYFLFRDTEDFKRLQIYIMVTQVIAVAVYIFYPTRQDLRPVTFAHDNLLTRGVQLLYRVDTNTGVCPSMHVAFSLGLASVWTKRRKTPVVGKALLLVAVILICLSTMFLKQHSVVDVLAAIPVCLVAEWFVFGRKGPVG